MDKLITNYMSVFPTWFLVMYAILFFAGIITALSSKKIFNRLIWLMIVIAVPVFGSLATIAIYMITDSVSRRHNHIKPDSPPFSLDYPYRKKFIVIPVVMGILGAEAGGELLEFYNTTLHDKIPFTITAESLPAVFALTTLFIMFISDYLRYYRSNVCLHINKMSESNNIFIRSEYIYNCVCIEEKPDILPVSDIVDNIATMFYRNSLSKQKESLWQYDICINNVDYGINSISYKRLKDNIDIESAEYCGNGITKMTMLQWLPDSTGNTADNTTVKRIIMWYVTPSFMPSVMETLTSFMLIMLIFTDTGTGIFCGITDRLAGFFG
ncbi:MAG: hypothetical protein K2G36_07845 [Ruminococcus sp.]|nr:hypothetical protein [Ruminococcus sp.]